MMPEESNKDLVLKVIESAHPQLSKFAQDSYGMHGRGVTRVDVPELPSGATLMVKTGMVYHTLAEIQELMAGMDSKNEPDVLIRMIETYDPTKQAVVMVQIGKENPISVKMRLDAPFIDNEPLNPKGTAQ